MRVVSFGWVEQTENRYYRRASILPEWLVFGSPRCPVLISAPGVTMRLPRLRFRLRGLMVLVAVVGLGLGATLTTQRRQERFLRLADSHFQRSSRYHHARIGSAIIHDDASCPEFRQKGHLPSEGGWHHHPLSGLSSKHDEDWSIHHDTLYLKYMKANQSPRRPVEADPPLPPGQINPIHDRGRPAPGPGRGPFGFVSRGRPRRGCRRRRRGRRLRRRRGRCR